MQPVAYTVRRYGLDPSQMPGWQRRKLPVKLSTTSKGVGEILCMASERQQRNSGVASGRASCCTNRAKGERQEAGGH